MSSNYSLMATPEFRVVLCLYSSQSGRRLWAFRGMSVPPRSVGRGEVTIQPAFFTSSLFVHPLRDDIFNLIQTYIQTYTLHPTDQPFALFKKVWTQQGWPWLHLKILDARGRESFLNSVFRLFLGNSRCFVVFRRTELIRIVERTVVTEPVMFRVVGLFGLYTFYMSQPSTLNPAIHRVPQISIPCGMFECLRSIPMIPTYCVLP